MMNEWYVHGLMDGLELDSVRPGRYFFSVYEWQECILFVSEKHHPGIVLKGPLEVGFHGDKWWFIHRDLFLQYFFWSANHDNSPSSTADEGVSEHTRSSWPTRLRHVLEAVIMGLTVVRMNNGQGLLHRAQVAGAWEA